MMPEPAVRQAAIERLRAAPDTVKPDQAYVVEEFRPGDAEGVAGLFYRTYADSYPIGMYYVPDELRLACARGDLIPVVARLPDGNIVGFSSLYRSSPPFTGLMEIGLGMVHPAYRGSFVLFHLFSALNSLMETRPRLEAVFGEAVCDTIITQHASALFGFRECALEMDLMPGTGLGRVACLVMFRNIRDTRRKMFLPARRERAIQEIAARLELDREFIPAAGGACGEGHSLVRSEVFSFAGLLRGHLVKTGRDCPETIEEEETAALAAGCRRFQWFVNLGDAGAAAAEDVLRARGYGFAGIVPRWFGDDAMLMHKFLDPPAVQGVNLYSDTARAMLEMTLADL